MANKREIDEITLYGDYILTETTSVEEESESKIIVPEHVKTNMDKNYWVKVVKVGKDVEAVKEGDIIYAGGISFGVYPLSKDETYWIMKEKQLVTYKNL